MSKKYFFAPYHELQTIPLPSKEQTRRLDLLIQEAGGSGVPLGKVVELASSFPEISEGEFELFEKALKALMGEAD